MVIDFHTHAFPDSLAARAVGSLTERTEGVFPPVSDGTIAGLVAYMDKCGVDISVLQPVITKQSQTTTLNEWAISVKSDRILPFGGIYSHTDDYKRDIDFVVSLGLRGLKFHPEYQDFVVDDAAMLPIYDYALSRGLILLFHAGFDPAFKAPFRSSPKQYANISRAMRGGTIVAAHMGGQYDWDATERELVGTDVYLDTSMGLDFGPTEQFLRIVKAHGADKILFATDSPWSAADAELARLRALPLSDSEREAILCGNAKRVLGL